MIKGRNDTEMYCWRVIWGETVAVPFGQTKKVPVELTIVAVGCIAAIVGEVDLYTKIHQPQAQKWSISRHEIGNSRDI